MILSELLSNLEWRVRHGVAKRLFGPKPAGIHELRRPLGPGDGL